MRPSPAELELPSGVSTVSVLSGSELEARCRRALLRGARQHWRGPRAELRRAVRRFLRRHRRDRHQLEQALRAVAASSAAALWLLGLAPAADAGNGFVDLSYHRRNPLPRLSVEGTSTPALADIDGDGDLDAFSGDVRGRFSFFENTGTAGAAAFIERTGNQNPLDGFDVGTLYPEGSAPAFADIDADGDLDLISGEEYGSFAFFENTGSATNPAFAARTGTQNPLDGHNTYQFSTPAFADIDADGDLDVFSGDHYGYFFFFQNIGSPSTPAFVPGIGALNPLGAFDVGYNSAPAFVDVDDDGDLDALSGRGGVVEDVDNGTFVFFENTGSAILPAFVERTGTQSPFDGFDVGTSFAVSRPTFADIDGDGDLDLFSGMGAAGTNAGTFAFYENTGSSSAPAFAHRTGSENPLDGFDVGDRSAPLFADIDGDGDLDVFSGNRSGAFAFFENTGTARAPAFADRSGTVDPLDGFDVGQRSTPALVDIDGDGDLDAFSGEIRGAFFFLENTGSATSPGFVQRSGTQNPLDGFNVDVGYNYGVSAPAFVDIDDDGDFDAFSGELFGRFVFFENTESATSPGFVQRSGTQNPLDGFDVVVFSAPAFADVDGDGDHDLMAGNGFGTFSYFENTGSASGPAFALRTGSLNPLGDQEVIYGSIPALADLDGDGDLDVLSGVTLGTFVYYENRAVMPLPIPRWARLGAALGLLAGLWRRRRGRGP